MKSTKAIRHTLPMNAYRDSMISVPTVLSNA